MRSSAQVESAEEIDPVHRRIAFELLKDHPLTIAGKERQSLQLAAAFLHFRGIPGLARWRYVSRRTRIACGSSVFHVRRDQLNGIAPSPRDARKGIPFRCNPALAAATTRGSAEYATDWGQGTRRA